VAAQEAQVLKLKFRRAEDVIPMLRPYIDPAGQLGGQGDQLVVRTTLQNLAQIRQLLVTLDRPPRWLTIAVRLDRPPAFAGEATLPNGQVVTDSRAAVAPADNGAARVTTARSSEQLIRVQEDAYAPLRFETAVPMTFRHFAIGARGVEEVRGTITYDSMVDYVVRPRLIGTAVSLEIEPQDNTLLTDRGQRGRLSLTAQGRLGDWIAVGGADLRSDDETASTSGTLQARTQPVTNQRGVWLKVELEPDPPR
jgi:hypothetical protein